MKILYLDCSSGICGNMVLGALTDILEDKAYLIHELSKLHIDGYKVNISKKLCCGVESIFVDVTVDGIDEYGHEHHIEGQQHHHEHRSYQNLSC